MLAESEGTLDLRDCYWGTADSTQIAEWIHDGTDDPTRKTVDWWPIRTEPLPAAEASVGRFKAGFRR